MRKISLLILLIFLIPIKIYAQDSLYDTETGLITQETTVCANKEYTFVQDSQLSRALVILDENNNYLLSKIINQEEVSLTFPTNLNKVQIIIADVTDDKIDYSNSYKVSYTIEDCGYTGENEYKGEVGKLVVDYDGTQAKISYKDAKSIKYQVKDSKVLKTIPESGIEISAPGIVQIQVNLSDGKKEYFELQFIDEESYFIRKVTSLQTREIKINTFISLKSIVMIVLLFILYIYFKRKVKKYKKKQKRQQIRKRNISRKDKKRYKKDVKRKK